MSRILFIINPISGGLLEIIKHKIAELTIARYSDMSFVLTEYAGHARELAAKAVRDGHDVVVAVGGDGTVNEVASALVGTEAALGIVPLGSGNGLARHLGIPLQTGEAIRALLETKPVVIDSATINGTPFFCTAGIGFDAQVAADYAQAGIRGLVTYAREAVRDWKAYKPAEYVIETSEGVLRTEALLITVGNANQWGNDFYITPQASLQDGQLDVTIVKPASLKANTQMLWQLRRKTLSDNPDVISLRSSFVLIDCPSSPLLTAHYDGEVTTLPCPIRFECHKATLNVIPGDSFLFSIGNNI